MSRFLETLLFLSAAGSLLGLLLILIRKIAGTRVPAVFFHAAWVMLFLRLVIPAPGLVPGLSEAEAAVFPEPASVVRTEPVSAVPAAKTGTDYTPVSADTAVPGTRTGNAAVPAPVQAQAEPSHADARDDDAFPFRAVLTDPVLWFLIWLTGALVSLVKQLTGYWRFLSLLRPSFVPATGEAAAVWDSFDGPKPELFESALIRTPMLVGCLHPKILVPEGVLPGESAGMILDHERTHFRHGDLYLKWFTVLVSSLHWFNPLMRLFRSELDRVMELSCDAHVLRGLTSAGRKAYGEALLDAAARRPHSCQLVSITFVTEKRNLKERLVQIMQYKIPKKSLLILLTLVILLFAGCLAVSGPASASPSAPPPLALEPEVRNVPAETVSAEKTSIVFPGGASGAESAVVVKDVDSFLSAVRPDTVIELAPGEYDLTKARDYGSANTGSEYYRWAEAYDGYELVLQNVSGLTVRSASGNPSDVQIVTRPRYANVLSLYDCVNVSLQGVTAGHTIEAGAGECTGGVINLVRCTGTDIRDCSLYGCGVLAIWAESCSGIHVSGSDLYECSYGAVELSGSSDVLFEKCIFRDCGEVTDDPYADLISVLSCHNVAFLDSTFTGNRTATVLATDWSDQVYFLGNTVHHEKIGRNSFVFRFFGKPVAVVDGCAFTGTAPFCEPSSLRPLSLSRDPLSDEDLSAMRQSASDFKGFEALATPDVKELTQEEISGLDLPASAEGMRTVKVSNVDEFLAAIAPDTVVYMEKGTYNLSEASGYGSIWNDYLSWENPYDGPGLILTGVSGLQIVGAGKDETFLVTEPRYADVLTFDSCSGIELTGLTAGHTQEPGECIGGVLMFRGSSGIGVTSCGLFGCGIRGITAWETQQVTVKDCEIYSCSLGAVQLESCHDFEFSGNSIHDCAYPTFQLFNSSSVVLDGKALSPNASIDLPGAGPYKKAGF